MMKFLLTVLVLCVSMLQAEILLVNDKTKLYDILPSSKIYIDTTRKITLDAIKTKQNLFQKNDKSLLGYGYSPNFDVWIQFTLKNNTNKSIQKILEYGNSMTTDILFYDSDTNSSIIDGHLHISPTRKTINPIFKITLQPNETKRYYLRASSYITILNIQLKLYKQDVFYQKELTHQAVLFLFFGAMLMLIIYNLFIYLFSRDINYLFYVLYITGVVIHHLMYVGIAPVYLLNQQDVMNIIGYASLISIFPIVALAFFTKFFINLKQYKLLDTILNIILFFTLLLTLFFLFTDKYNTFRNLLPIVLFAYLVFITLYAVLKKNRQAYFIFAGWLLIFTAISLMYLSSVNLFNIYDYFSYTIESALVLEAILFSIALSDKINILKTKLIVQKKTENERLELQVQEKTRDLNISLEEKTLLLQELNHRVKNNMQMIVSLIRLQTNDIDDKKIQALFLTTQNRLNAMSELHELLYQKEDISYINAYEYFTTLIEGLQETYTQDVSITYKIDTDLQTEQAISCGIILNELVTNALKHAFLGCDKKKKTIDISLIKNEHYYLLKIEDNGMGYDNHKIIKSFGLILVTTLVESKLQGDIQMDTNNGVSSKIIWREEDE